MSIDGVRRKVAALREQAARNGAFADELEAWKSNLALTARSMHQATLMKLNDAIEELERLEQAAAQTEGGEDAEQASGPPVVGNDPAPQSPASDGDRIAAEPPTS